MGMLERFRAGPETTEDSWTPPAFGTCRCEGHIEDVLELRIPLASGAIDGPATGAGDMAVWALLTSGGLVTLPLGAEHRHLTNGLSIVRHGPFHWRVVAGERLAPFLTGGDMHLLEEALSVQPGVDRAMWSHREKALVVAAPRLCANGIQCAVVQALRAPYVRQERPGASTAAGA